MASSSSTIRLRKRATLPRPWTRTALRAGERITLRMNPLRDGHPGGLFLDLVKGDGTMLDSGLPKNGTPINVPQL